MCLSFPLHFSVLWKGLCKVKALAVQWNCRLNTSRLRVPVESDAYLPFVLSPGWPWTHGTSTFPSRYWAGIGIAGMHHRTQFIQCWDLSQASCMKATTLPTEIVLQSLNRLLICFSVFKLTCLCVCVYIWSSDRAVSALNHWGISAAPNLNS